MRDAKSRNAFGRMAGKAFIGILAIVGFFSLVGPMACSAIRPLVYSEEKFPPIKAPAGSLETYRTITTGGMGTVWTTRIKLADSKSGREWLIYEASDSDYVPTLRWLDGETLLLTLPCERVDHFSNPSDWDGSKVSIERVAVRFTYARPCDQAPVEESK